MNNLIIKDNRIAYNKNMGGFTFLELLIVIGILTTMTLIALPLLESNNDQVRYDDTKNRLQVIRNAIIGDTSRTINGAPEIRGYVADMGSLPENLNALMRKDYCNDPQYLNETDCVTHVGVGEWNEQGGVCLEDISYTDETSCTNPPHNYTWKDDYTYVPSTGLWVGWNGPYLKSPTTFDPTDTANGKKYKGYVDGWGNTKDPDTNADPNNFGWRFAIYKDSSSDTEEHLLVQSLGRDMDSISTTDDYDTDYPRVEFPDTPNPSPPNYYYSTSFPPVYPTPGERFISENEYRQLITDGSGNGGVFVEFLSTDPCWGCWDGSNYITTLPHDRKTCEATTGQTWRPLKGISDKQTCENSPSDSPPGNNSLWLQDTPVSEPIYLKVIYRNEGKLIEAKSDPVSFTWNGGRQIVEFKFTATGGNTPPVHFPMGLLSYNLYEYDSSETPPDDFTSKLFQTENTIWEQFFIVPKASNFPLRWELQ